MATSHNQVFNQIYGHYMNIVKPMHWFPSCKDAEIVNSSEVSDWYQDMCVSGRYQGQVLVIISHRIQMGPMLAPWTLLSRVSFVRIREKIDHIIMAPPFILRELGQWHGCCFHASLPGHRRPTTLVLIMQDNWYLSSMGMDFNYNTTS